jgi:glutaredoxin
MENSQYTLYVKAGCPFCAKVLNFMDEHDIVLPIMDISLEPYKDGYDKLINLGGK